MSNTFAALAWATCIAAASWATPCSAGEARAPSTYMYILMVDMIGPAANSLWAAAATAKLSDQDWLRVKDMTSRLTETADAVSFGGTTSGDIERATSSEWKSWASRLTVTIALAANAVERRDEVALASAADRLVEVCQGCHVAFPQAAQ